MKLFLIAFAVIAAVAADVSHLPSNDYLPPVQEAVQVPSNDYLPPVQQAAPAPIEYAAPVQYAPEPEPAHEVAQDGYRYKTHRRVVYRRHRRDVSHLPSNEYLPPVQEQAAPAEVHYEAPVAQVQYSAPAEVHYEAPVPQVQQYSAPVEAEPAHELADDGYRYKTHRRVVYRRHRRDVSHLPSNDYLPPVQEAVEVPSNDYLPPVQQAAPAPIQYSAPVQYAPEPEPAHEVAQDGYRYKTHRRVVYRRHRRDVSHLPSNEYLPPVQEQAAPAEVHYEAPVAQVQQYSAPAEVHHEAPVAQVQVQQYSAPVEAEPAHELADDGYRYKTHRRVVYRRHRRDVSHLPSNEYLPPVQEQAAPAEVHYEAPVAQVQQYSAPAEVHYEAPVAQVQVQQYSAPVEAEPAHELADDGYRYKTHRRVVYRRHRRDVSHLPSNEYLPPVQEQAAPAEVHYEAPVAQVQQYSAPAEVHYEAPVPQVQQYSAPVEAEPAHELADDGYRYKTHRRVVYRRHRRDVSHLPSNEYLPPVQEQAAPAEVHYEAPVAQVQQYSAPAEVHYEAPVAQVQQYSAPVEAEPAHELADDGYRYKTHRRVVYRRHRRDVSHLPSNEYLPPVQEQAAPAEVHYEAPVAQVQQYSAPAEVHHEAPVAQVQVQQYSAPVEAEPAHELAQDGYRYKTHRRVVYRRH